MFVGNLGRDVDVTERLRVRLLGGFAVEGIAERDLASRKGRTLLKVLAAARGAPVSVDRIAEVLWGDDQPSRPGDQVGVLVSRLRGVLGASRIVRTDAGYALVAGWMDVDELLELAEVAAQALGEGRVASARAAAGAALALVSGPLLPDEDGPWIEPARVTVQAAITRLQRVAVDAAIAAGDHGAAAALAEQALAADPYDEVVLRALMNAHLAAGRPSSALAAYARVRETLAEDLGVPPTAETEALHARALAAADGDLVPVAAPAQSPGGATIGLVGRARELAVLDAALGQAATGGVALVVVEGDAGIGKTTLVDSWVRRVRDKGGAVVLWGQCDELGRDLPLQPVTDALAEYLRTLGAERAKAVLNSAGGAAVLAPVLGPVTGESATVIADTEAGRSRLFAALVAVLANSGTGTSIGTGSGTAAGAVPAVLVIEDLHLAGAGTRAWLRFARRRGRHTVLVVTTWPGGDKGLDLTHRIRLGPLERDAVVEWVGEARATSLYERSGGHPLLLSALATSAGAELPATLADSVGARVDSLGEEAGATLRVAAVLGPECDLDLVAAVKASPVGDVLGHLEAAWRAGLVMERGSRFVFRHQLIRQALEAATGAARRAVVHREAARVLSGRPNPDLLAVAVHARAGGDDQRAASAFVAAASAAASRFDLDAAEDHLAAALGLGESADAYIVRARVRMSRLALAEAAADAERAVALGGGGAALEVAGWVAYYRRRYDEARAYAEEAAARAAARAGAAEDGADGAGAAEDGAGGAGGAGGAVRISALALAGRVRHGAGDLAGAIEHLTAVGDGPPSVRGIADVWLAQARAHQGRPLDALRALARPMVEPDSLAHPWAPLHLRFNRVLALGQLGRVSEALVVAADLKSAVERGGKVGARFVGPAANVEAWILRWSGREDEADEKNQMAVAATGGDSGPGADALAESHYVALLDLADGCLLRDEVDEASTLVDRLAVLDTWNGTMAWHQRHRVNLLRARLALESGDSETAAHLASLVAADAARRGAGRYHLLAQALGGLADPSVPSEDLDSVIDGLGRCAVLDSWPLVAALGAARGRQDWVAEAERRATVVVTQAGAQAEPARRFADRVLKA